MNRIKSFILVLSVIGIVSSVYWKLSARNSGVEGGIDTAISDGNYTFSNTGVYRKSTGTVALPFGEEAVRNIAVDNIGRTKITYYVQKTTWITVASSTRLFVQNGVFPSSAQTYNDTVFAVAYPTAQAVLRQIIFGRINDGDRVRIWDARGDTTVAHLPLVWERILFSSETWMNHRLEFDIPLSSGLQLKHTGTSEFSLGWDETVEKSR